MPMDKQVLTATVVDRGDGHVLVEIEGLKNILESMYPDSTFRLSIPQTTTPNIWMRIKARPQTHELHQYQSRK